MCELSRENIGRMKPLPTKKNNTIINWLHHLQSQSANTMSYWLTSRLFSAVDFMVELRSSNFAWKKKVEFRQWRDMRRRMMAVWRINYVNKGEASSSSQSNAENSCFCHSASSLKNVPRSLRIYNVVKYLYYTNFAILFSFGGKERQKQAAAVSSIRENIWKCQLQIRKWATDMPTYFCGRFSHGIRQQVLGKLRPRLSHNPQQPLLCVFYYFFYFYFFIFWLCLFFRFCSHHLAVRCCRSVDEAISSLVNVIPSLLGNE